MTLFFQSSSSNNLRIIFHQFEIFVLNHEMIEIRFSLHRNDIKNPKPNQLCREKSKNEKRKKLIRVGDG